MLEAAFHESAAAAVWALLQPPSLQPHLLRLGVGGKELADAGVVAARCSHIRLRYALQGRIRLQCLVWRCLAGARVAKQHLYVLPAIPAHAPAPPTAHPQVAQHGGHIVRHTLLQQPLRQPGRWERAWVNGTAMSRSANACCMMADASMVVTRAPSM